MSDKALAFADAHQQDFLDDLKRLLRIPSISALPEHAPDLRLATEWLASELSRIGLEGIQVMDTGGHPVVYGEWLHASEAPTILVYGHYDVQPADPLGAWDSPPFEATVRDGFLYARGASDDKGQLLAQLKALECLLASEGKLPINVKILLEGEEEIGSPSLRAYLVAHRMSLSADSISISDGIIHGPDQPSLTYAHRGLLIAEVDVYGPSEDMHSGLVGGSLHNPAQALAEILAGLHSPEGQVAVPAFYEKVRPLDEGERAELVKVSETDEAWKSRTGAPKPWGEAAFTITERISARPTLDINGVYGGYQGVGMKTVIPAHAGAKLTLRLVPDQNPGEIAALLEEYIKQNTPETVTIKLTFPPGGASPVVVDRQSPFMQAASKAYRKEFGVEPVFDRSGGSMPAVALFQEILGCPSIMINMGLRDDGFHAPNERFSIDLYFKGIRTLVHYYRLASEIGQPDKV